MDVTFQPGHFMWHELVTPEPERAIDYYGAIAGMQTRAYYPKGSDKPYWTWVDRFGPLGALLTLDDAAKARGHSPHWFANVMVKDLDACLQEAQTRGATLLRGPEPMGTVGWWAVIRDPQGAEIAAFAAKDPLPARDPLLCGGFVWNELMAWDLEAAFSFYQALFGWEKLQTIHCGALGEYLIYGVYGEAVGGMFTRPADDPTPVGWVYYVQVDALDAAVDLALTRGTRLIRRSDDIPGRGRIAQLVDPQGVLFGLREKPAR